MKLIPPEQAPTGPSVREYRDISWRGLLYAGVIFLTMAAYTLLPKDTGPSWGAALLPFLAAALFFLMAAWRRKDARRAWLLKSAPDGLYINLGYSDGYFFRGSSDAVLFIAAPEVAGIAVVLEVMRLPYRIGMTRHHFSCLDIQVSGSISDEIRAHLQEQQACFSKAGKSGPYPVRINAPGQLRLGWGWIKPGAKETAQQLAEYYTLLKSRNVAYPDWDQLNPVQQDLYLDILWQMGMTTESLFLGRQHHRIRSKEVRLLLEKRNPPGRFFTAEQHKP